MTLNQGPSFKLYPSIMIRQRGELAEWFGFETRNKYEFSTPEGQALAFAAEQGKGVLGLLIRQILGHWRSFELRFFTPDHQPFMRANHPFRWYFQELEVKSEQGLQIGRIVKRFSILSKSFEVRNAMDQVVLEVSSPIWRIWTFSFTNQGSVKAEIQKKWTGLIAEAFTDKDRFMLNFQDPGLPDETRKLLMAAALFIDLMYFEKKANS